MDNKSTGGGEKSKSEVIADDEKDPGKIKAPESVKREGESSPDRAERDPKATTAAKETKKKNVDRKRLRPDRECCRA